MSRHPAALLFSLLLFTGAPIAHSDDGASLSSDSGWQHIDDKSGVALYSRARAGTGVKEFRGVGTIDAPPSAVEKVLSDIPSYPSFMPYVSESRLISQSGSQTVTYQRLDVPFVSNRDYTIRVDHGAIHSSTGATGYRDSWETDNSDGPAERHGLVRVNVNEGSWVLEPSGPGGDSTLATYQIYTDSGGLPSFLANRASQLIIPKLFDAIRKQVRDPKYQH